MCDDVSARAWVVRFAAYGLDRVAALWTVVEAKEITHRHWCRTVVDVVRRDRLISFGAMSVRRVDLRRRGERVVSRRVISRCAVIGGGRGPRSLLGAVELRAPFRRGRQRMCNDVSVRAWFVRFAAYGLDRVAALRTVVEANEITRRHRCRTVLDVVRRDRVLTLGIRSVRRLVFGVRSASDLVRRRGERIEPPRRGERVEPRRIISRCAVIG